MSFVRVAKRAELPPGTGKTVMVEGKPVALFHAEGAEGALRRAIADIDGAAAFRILRAEVARQGHVDAVGRPPQQLPAHAEVVLLLDPVAGGDIVDRPPAIGRRNGDARGDGLAQRTRDRCLGLLEIVVA